MLNDSDLHKAAEEMLNKDAHDEVWKIIFLTHFTLFLELMIQLHLLYTCRFYLSLVQPGHYPGPRGFLLFFIGKFCDANRFLYIFFFIGTKR